MTEPVFYADPMRLLIASAAGILLLLFLIIKLKLHPVISMMISAVLIGIGAGMPLHMIGETVEKGVGKTLQGIALLIGLGSMFGGMFGSQWRSSADGTDADPQIWSAKSRMGIGTYGACARHNRIF